MAEDICPLLPNSRRHYLSTNSDVDVVHIPGNLSLNSDVPYTVENGNEASSPVSTEEQRKHWQLNYQEAAIYLQEGENNDKFSSHPKSQDALPAYLIAHNQWFHILDLAAALLLMSLALVERPHVHPLHAPVGVHASLELLGLLILGLELGMRLKWLGFRAFVRHIRSMIKAGTLAIMLVEAIVVLIRRTSHFRVTRAFRPIFLIDSYYCRGVRRFIRQIIQSLPPILDMLMLLLFFMLIFSILGFYLFSNDGGPKDPYFDTIQQSFISLFILLTTANYPDVMMPAYSKNRWYVLFFVTYLALELYFLMNLLLAVVYDTFLRIEKEKLKKLLLHKREACEQAFKLLVSKQNPTRVTLRHFAGLMKQYEPKKSRRDVYLTFKTLNISKTGYLSQEEFHKVYALAALSWKHKSSDGIWSSNFYFPLNRIFKAMHWLVSWSWFDYFIYLVIAINFVCIFVETIQISVNEEQKLIDFQVTPYSILFVCIYVIEVILKVLGLGPKKYFFSGWNIFDFLVTIAAVAGILLTLSDHSFYYIVVLRPFRLLRLFKLKKRFRDVLGTLFILFTRMVSLAIVMILLYYFFSIIGMELFSKYDMRNCCKNTSVEVNYEYDNVTGKGGYYYLNTFDNVLISGVTLFELTVVNNWYIIMEGYAAKVSGWTRIYFMVFYIVTMVVMTIVVAFILEAFLFRIQYRRKMCCEDMEDHAMVKIDIGLTPEELHLCVDKNLPLTGFFIKQQGLLERAEATESMSESGQTTPAAEEGVEGILTVFRGERLRSKEDFSLRMYQDEVEEWIKEYEIERQRMVEELQDVRRQELAVTGRLARTNTI